MSNEARTLTLEELTHRLLAVPSRALSEAEENQRREWLIQQLSEVDRLAEEDTEQRAEQENVEPHEHEVFQEVNGVTRLVPCTNSECPLLATWRRPEERRSEADLEEARQNSSKPLRERN